MQLSSVLTFAEDPSTAGSLRRGRDKARTPDALERACQEMESLFINQLLKEMRQSIPKGGIAGESSAEDMFTGMHDAELARNIAGSGGLGLARILMAQLARDPGDDPGAAGPALKLSVAGTDNPGERRPPAATQAVAPKTTDAPDPYRHRR